MKIFKGSNRRSDLVSRILVYLLSITLIICNLIRILRVPITVDEAPSRTDLLLTYGDYAHLNKISANTHILNSILRKACIEIFNNTPFYLRLPNFLAYILFLIFGYQLICRLFKEEIWRLAAFLVINLNPFIFEFFGYSRGYGLALGFMTMSIYFLVAYIDERRLMQAVAALLCGAASVYSNFTLLNFYLGLCGALIILGILPGQRAAFLRKTLPCLILISGILSWLIYEPINRLRVSGELYYGGDRGLFDDTIRSLVRESLYTSVEDSFAIMFISITVVVLILSSMIYWILIFRRQWNDISIQKGAVLCILLITPLLSTKVQHSLFGTKFLIDRTAMFIIVLCALNAAYLLYVLRGGRILRISSFVIVAIAGFHIWNFAEHINLHKSRTWWLDNYNVKMLGVLTERRNEADRPIKLRVSWINMPSIDYYIYTRYNAQFFPLEYIRASPGPADTAYDYCYLPAEDAKTISDSYVVDTSFENGFFLYKKKATFSE